MVVVQMLTKLAHFILVKFTNSYSEVAKVFIREIVRLHGVPMKIVSYKDVKFTSRFWKALLVGLGTNLAFSTTYHPQTDEKAERVNMILEDMLRMYIMH